MGQAPENTSQLEWARGQVALALSDVALEICPAPDNSGLRAGILNRRGEICLARTESDRAGNVREALRCFEESIGTQRENAPACQWAPIHMNLGQAYRQNPDAKPSENFRKVIDHFESALRGYDEIEDTDLAAEAKMHLGEAHRDRPDGDRTENLKIAAAFLEKALAVWREEYDPAGLTRLRADLDGVWNELMRNSEPVE